MTEENSTDTAESDQKNSVQNMTPNDFINRRVGSSQKEESQVVAKEEAVEEEVVEKSATDEVTEETEADVLSQLDLDSMSEDQIKEVSKKLNSNAVARYGELTAKRKAAEERMAKMEEQLNNLQQQKEERVPVVKDNPLKKIVDPQALQQESANAQEVVDWAEDLLYEKGDYGPEDVIATVEGRDVTKAEVRKTLRHSQNMLRKFIPAQMQTIKKQHDASQAKSAFEQKARVELPWMKNEQSEVYKKYQSMMGDKRLSDLTKDNPEVAVQMPYLVAHAANSMYGRKAITSRTTPAPRIRSTPPKTASTTAAKSEKTAPRTVKKIQSVSQQFSDSGTAADFVALRTLQMQNRK